VAENKHQSKKKLINADNKYEVPLDNSLMQRIKASEIILENEMTGTITDDSISPMSYKNIDSPEKSNPDNSSHDVGMTDENNNPNDYNTMVQKRESLFDLKRKNKQKQDQTMEPKEKNNDVEMKIDQPANETEEIKEASTEECLGVWSMASFITKICGKINYIDIQSAFIDIITLC
jgi:hypothetical protein